VAGSEAKSPLEAGSFNVTGCADGGVQVSTRGRLAPKPKFKLKLTR
jgi:hypothetical protein